MMVVAVLACAMLSVGTAWAQDQATGEGGAAPAASAAAEQPSLQQQIEDLRARLSELEAMLAESKEATSRELYAISDAQSKFVTGEKVKISGYIQSQFTSDQAADPRTDFRVRRARIKVQAPVTNMASGTIEFDTTRTVELKEAFLDLGRTTDIWRLRFGQAKVPFMYDILQSSSVRLAPEQTAVAQYVFPGEYDQGLWLQFNNALGDSVPGTTLDLGVQNGQGPNATELDNTKDIVARLRFVLGDTPPDKDTEANSLYIGYLNGEMTDSKTIVTTDKTGIGGGLSYLLGPAWFRGEYLTGEKSGHDYAGWYGQLACEVPGTPGTLFARYERFDEDTGKSGNLFSDLTVGYQHQIDPKTRATLAYEFRDPESGYSKFAKTDGNLLTARVQVKY
jgi:hypothetical protein